MGWLSLLVPQSTPFMSWFKQNQNLVHGAGAGLGQGDTFSEGLGYAAKNAAAGAQVDSDAALAAAKEKERLDNIQKAQDWLRSNFPKYASLPGDMGIDLAKTTLEQQLKAPADQADTSSGRAQLADQYGLTGQDKTDFVLTGKLPGSNQSVRAGVGQPIFGKNTKTLKIEPWQSMTDGTMVNIADPNANPADYNFDPAITAQQRAAGAASGKIGGTTAAGLGIAAQNAENALAAIDKLRTDTQGVDQTYGTYGPFGMIPDQWGLTVPGTPKADFKATLDQAKGQAFLQAYTTLKGAGAITDIEGQKAGQALARINDPNISKDAFYKALDDYEQVIRAGYQRLQQQAQQYGGDNADTQPQLGGGGPSAGKVLTYNPQTGELE